MPTWTLRFIVCAGLVALLCRLPAVPSVADAFFFSATTAALVLVSLQTILYHLLLVEPGAHLLRLSRIHPTHGADA